jgi:hypothetical protein
MVAAAQVLDPTSLYGFNAGPGRAL